MNKPLKTAITALVLFTLGLSVQAQSSVPDAVVTATRNNDSRVLASYFNDKIELIIPGKSGVFSSAQAEQVIKNFFVSNPAGDFKIIHQGVRDNSSFAIGKYASKNGDSYRVYFLVKDSGGSILIHQLRIETQDE
ncbi:MAG: DUF4783 domain-containing protein [Breznakibacter sp.]